MGMKPRIPRIPIATPWVSLSMDFSGFLEGNYKGNEDSLCVICDAAETAFGLVDGSKFRFVQDPEGDYFLRCSSAVLHDPAGKIRGIELVHNSHEGGDWNYFWYWFERSVAETFALLEGSKWRLEVVNP